MNSKLFIYGLLALSSVAFASCSDDEELLEPSSEYVDNKFAVPDDATGPEADLRREFFASTDVYLLFDDLLSREFKGVDEFGGEIWQEERIDFIYDLTSYGFNAPRFEYIETQEDKEIATSLVRENILPRLEGGILTPFSILLVKDMQTYQSTGSGYRYADAYTTSCWRCLAVAVGKWSEAEGEERDAITTAILKDFLSTRFTVDSESASEFRTLSYEYSGYYMYELYDDWVENPDITRVYELGFLSKKTSYWGDDYLPYTKDDFDAYLDVVLSMDENEFMELYGEYSMIVTKYTIIKDALISLGFKF